MDGRTRKMMESLVGEADADALSPKLVTKERTTINNALSKAGFDGNGRFQSVGNALNKAGSVLQDNGIEWGEVMSAHLFQGAEGRRNARLARSNSTDAFSPVELRNTVMVLTWHELAKDRFEVIAYLS